jgi:competence protein ComEA
VRLSSRCGDDADVIRARLRALLADRGTGGWVPEDDDPDDSDRWHAGAGGDGGFEPDEPDEPDEPAAQLPRGLGRHRAPDRTVRWDPGRGGARSLWVAGLVAAVVLVAWTWWDRPRVEPVGDAAQVTSSSAAESGPTPRPVGEAASTSSTVVVSVVGLVARPGLVTLPSGARVADAVEAAGGLLPEADPATVNLAVVVTDGEQIAVGVSAVIGVAPPAGAAGDGRIDLNTADAAELDALPGIGPVLAERIVDYRTRHGPFRSVEQLEDVPGIGPSKAAELAERVSV